MLDLGPSGPFGQRPYRLALRALIGHLEAPKGLHGLGTLQSQRFNQEFSGGNRKRHVYPICWVGLGGLEDVKKLHGGGQHILAKCCAKRRHGNSKSDKICRHA